MKRCWKEDCRRVLLLKLRRGAKVVFTAKTLGRCIGGGTKEETEGRDGNQDALGFKNGYSDLDHGKI